MQKTKNHDLNLVEMSDTFSTQPLNENMETIDAALQAISDTASAISKRVVSLEAKHIAFGTYSGSGSSTTITVGFRPRGVAIGGAYSTVIVGNVGDVNGTYGSLTDSGFRVSGTYSVSGKSYNYIAFD